MARQNRAGEVIAQDDVLKGRTAMSIAVSVEGMRDIPEEEFRSDIETRLRQSGITILPPASPRTYPCLALDINVNGYSDIQGVYLIFGSIRLEYYQLFPAQLRGGKAGFIEARTWVDGTDFLMPGIRVLTIRGIADKITSQFCDGYTRANK